MIPCFLILLCYSSFLEEENGKTSEELQLLDADFDRALVGSVPASLRNVPLHQAGDIGWKDIGGLTSVKKTMIETLQWPEKVLNEIMLMSLPSLICLLIILISSLD